MWIAWIQEQWPFWLFGTVEMALFVYFLNHAARKQHEEHGPSLLVDSILSVHVLLLIVFATLLTLPALSVVFNFSF
jgi:hypothetical protein